MSLQPGLRMACTILAVFFCAQASAQDARIRTTLSSQEPVWVGQKVTVVVELLAPGIFSGPVNFDLPDPKGILLLPPDGHPVVSNETIDGTTYAVQRHELSAYPMQPGAQVIPAMKVRFAFKRNPLDANAVPVTMSSSELPFTVKTPPGAEHLGTVISARDLQIKETWNPQPGKEEIQAGAAFKRMVTFSAPDVPGMVFPPFPAGQVDGLGVYPKTAIHDETERGSLIGKRSDTITYACERPGEFGIPAVRFTWFDLETQQLQTKDFPAKKLTVIANPAMASTAGSDPTVASASQRLPIWWVLGVAAILVVAVGCGILLSARLRIFLARCFLPFSPSHLQPLNPIEPPQRNN